MGPLLHPKMPQEEILEHFWAGGGLLTMRKIDSEVMPRRRVLHQNLMLTLDVTTDGVSALLGVRGEFRQAARKPCDVGEIGRPSTGAL